MNIKIEVTRRTVDGSAFLLGVDQYVPEGCTPEDVAKLTRQALDAHKVVAETQQAWSREHLTPEELAQLDAVEQQLREQPRPQGGPPLQPRPPASRKKRR